MKTVFVKAVFDINCKIFNHAKKNSITPVYRVFVNDELFTERTWAWKDDFYLREEIQINADPGEYNIRYELVPPNLAKLLVTRPVVNYGSAVITEDGRLRIEDATA